jgi:hypothetical protein
MNFLCRNGVHNFKPRYDTTPPDFGEFEEMKASEKALDLLSKKVYVKDVCKRCGMSIDREAVE